MYIVGYTVGILVLRRRASGAVKRHLRTYTSIRPFPNVGARIPRKCDVINDVKLSPTVQYIAGYTVIAGFTVANFDVIQSEVALHKQVH